MTVRILTYVERKEVDVFQHDLTPEQYQEFLRLRQQLNTEELGNWVAEHGKGTYFDSYGRGNDTCTQIFDDQEKEYIQD